jgi:hypothetical protein
VGVTLRVVQVVMWMVQVMQVMMQVVRVVVVRTLGTDAMSGQCTQSGHLQNTNRKGHRCVYGYGHSLRLSLD